MSASSCRKAALLALPLLLSSPAFAEDDLKLVESIPPEVADIVTGGSWSDGKAGGFYRAFVIMSGEGEKFGAKVYLQWLAISDESPIPSVLKTVPVAEINEQGLANAAIDIEGEETKDNQILLMVSSYDFENDKDILLLVQAEGPGTYSMKKASSKASAPGPEENAEPAPANPTNVPKDD